MSWRAEASLPFRLPCSDQLPGDVPFPWPVRGVRSGSAELRRAVMTFDTPPLALDRRALRDYTSLHLYSATGLQLFRFDAASATLVPSACCHWSMSEDATQHAFRISGRRDQSAMEVAEDFARAILAAVDAVAPAGRRLDEIRELGVRPAVGGGAELIIRLMQADRQLAHKLAHPSFAAASSPGPFAWQERNLGGGRLVQQDVAPPQAALQLDYCVLDDVDAGVAAYDAGAVDSTCPVLHSPAVLKRLLGRPDLVQGRSNTFMALFPMSPYALQPVARRRLRDRLDVINLQNRFEPSLTLVGGFSRFSSLRRPCITPTKRSFDRARPMVLAYDPFSPNREVLEAVAERWEVGATLLADDFTTPSADCDFRLIILVNSHAYEGDAYRMIGRTEAVRSDPALHHQWWQQIAMYDAGRDDATRAAAVRRLDTLFREACPAILLGRLNAYHLQRPGLEWLDFSSDVSWERCR